MAIIQLASIGHVNQEMMQMISRHVKEMFGLEVEMYTPLPESDYAFDEKRGQYSSTVILQCLAPLCAPDVMRFLAITEADLFIPVMTFIFGQAQLSGKIAVVSLARLFPAFYGLPPNKDLTVRRIRKEISHELGHTFGLVHCSDRTCLMSLSTEIMQIDVKSEDLCRSCWIVLQENLTALKKETNKSKNVLELHK